MRVGTRMVYAEILRRARDETMLTLVATDAGFERLSGIEAALSMLRETPDCYGICEECGEPISLARLNAEPWATRCDAHAEAELIVH